MPYHNVVSSQIFSRLLQRRRLIAELPLHTAPTTIETEAIWTPLDFSLGQKKPDGPDGLPSHSWRPHSGVSSR